MGWSLRSPVARICCAQLACLVEVLARGLGTWCLVLGLSPGTLLQQLLVSQVRLVVLDLLQVVLLGKVHLLRGTQGCVVAHRLRGCRHVTKHSRDPSSGLAPEQRAQHVLNKAKNQLPSVTTHS